LNVAAPSFEGRPGWPLDAPKSKPGIYFRNKTADNDDIDIGVDDDGDVG